MAEAVEEIRERVEGRLKELEPYVTEYQALRRVRDAIDDETPSAAPGPAPSPRRRAAPARKLPAAGAGRAGNSARAEQAQELIAKQPGVTVAELAKAMGIGPTYLYRVLPRLEREGKLRKVGKGYHPA